MPLLAATGNDLWPQQGAEALLVAGKATASSVDPALVLELHSIWKPAPDDRDTAGAMAGSSSKERQDEARGVANEQGSLSTPRKEQCMDPLEAIQDGRHAMEQEPHQRTPDQVCPLRPSSSSCAAGGFGIHTLMCCAFTDSAPRTTARQRLRPPRPCTLRAGGRTAHQCQRQKSLLPTMQP